MIGRRAVRTIVAAYIGDYFLEVVMNMSVSFGQFPCSDFGLSQALWGFYLSAMTPIRGAGKAA